jgi:hypothetical protein
MVLGKMLYKSPRSYGQIQSLKNTKVPTYIDMNYFQNKGKDAHVAALGGFFFFGAPLY